MSVIIRLIVCSHPSGVVRRYEMRDSRPFSSGRWQVPHFRLTRSLVTGMPSSALDSPPGCAVCAAGRFAGA
ncbi:MAG: hypothetical protein AUI11_00755 [Acidobacteria bacterium 13_2_20CM_2_66_4]|nr:MAG: hypothetical protein AUI11_00755 [Acidobacteria bacterium 13_2_20CM_2_66_4]